MCCFEADSTFVSLERALASKTRTAIEQLELEKGQLAAKMERLRDRVRADAEHGEREQEAWQARALREDLQAAQAWVEDLTTADQRDFEDNDACEQVASEPRASSGPPYTSI